MIDPDWKPDMTIERLWNSFRDHVLPAEPSDELLNGCRDAFYGGGMAVFLALVEFQKEPVLIRRIKDELQAFLNCTRPEWKSGGGPKG